jgi:hypothetical protein
MFLLSVYKCTEAIRTNQKLAQKNAHPKGQAFDV